MDKSNVHELAIILQLPIKLKSKFLKSYMPANLESIYSKNNSKKNMILVFQLKGKIVYESG